MADEIWAIVPGKKLVFANCRLAVLLSEEERCQLASTMLSDVLAELRKSSQLTDVLVASEDPKINEIAKSFSARCLPNLFDTGLSPTLATASHLLAEEGAQGIIVVHADLPLLISADIDTVIRSISHKPTVALAPAKFDLGTNVLAMSPPGLIDYAFGEKSSLRHAAAARARCIEPIFIETPGLSFDLDTVKDLYDFASTPSDTATFCYVKDSGIREKVLSLKPDQLSLVGTG